MDREQFAAEKLYQLSLWAVRAMQREGILSREEASRARGLLLEQYRPVVGGLLEGEVWP